MSKARQLADLGNVYDDGALSSRNMLTNGSMIVAQRGTSFTTQASSAYSLDRWMNEHDAGTFDLDYLQDAGPKEHGFAYAQKVTVQSTATLSTGGYIIAYETRVERNVTDRLQWGTSNAQPFTLSFWIKSNRTGTYTVNLNMAVPTGGSDDATARQYTINSANTWEYKTLTFPANTTTYSGASYNARSLTLFWWMIAGSTYTSGSIPSGWENETQANRAVNCSNSTTVGDYWSMTGVQLEIGDTATPFEHEPYGVTLQKCQRYYYQDDTANHFLRSFYAPSTGDWYEDYPLPVVMRTTPTWTSQLGGDISRVNAVSISGRTAKSGYVRFTVSSVGQGYCSLNTVTADAEL